MLCQRCGKSAPDSGETCRHCGFALFSLAGGHAEEQGEVDEILGLDEHAVGRISALEKQVRRSQEEMEILVHALDFLERSVMVTRAGIHVLVRMLREQDLLEPREFLRRWLDRTEGNLAELEKKDRFQDCRDTILASFQGKGPKRFEEVVERAEDLFFRLESAKAMCLLEEALGMDPRNRPLAAFLGECHLANGDLIAARRYLGDTLEDKEPVPGALLAHVRLLLCEGRPEAASVLVEAAARKEPASADLWTLLALSRGLEGLWADCRQAADRAARLAEGPAPMYLLAHALLREGKVQEAERWLENLLSQHPDCEEALRQQAFLYLGRGWWNRGRQVLERLSALDPECSPETLVAQFKGESPALRRASSILDLQLAPILDIMGSAREQARTLLRQAEIEGT